VNLHTEINKNVNNIQATKLRQQNRYFQMLKHAQ